MKESFSSSSPPPPSSTSFWKENGPERNLRPKNKSKSHPKKIKKIKIKETKKRKKENQLRSNLGDDDDNDGDADRDDFDEKIDEDNRSAATIPTTTTSRIWYRCAWQGCSFGSFYNGVVRRHSHKRHSGRMKIDKSSDDECSHRFKCDWPGCEVSLVAYHKLVEHKRKHTGEKPFRCKWKSCNYATARLYSMIIHKRTHKLDPFDLQ